MEGRKEGRKDGRVEGKGRKGWRTGSRSQGIRKGWRKRWFSTEDRRTEGRGKEVENGEDEKQIDLSNTNLDSIGVHDRISY